jgi:TonB-linked SusC/RagA family outer membrane protein
MKKTIQTIVLAALCLNFTGKVQAQEPAKSTALKTTYTGKVISASTSEVLPGAVIKINHSNQTLITNDRGEFTLNLTNGSYSLSVNYLSHKTKTLSIQIPLKEPLLISLDIDEQNLQEVEIVSTGYQNIPKERATGSFTQIDNKTINRSVGINIIDRLEGVTSGLLLNRGTAMANTPKISIHGRSTIFASAEPLIVLNGFAYDGTIDQINPADIETIDVLKDAAASSIWGSRSGNGVVVITTKSGRKNQKLTVGVNSTLTVSGKPDLFYSPQMTTSDAVDLEQLLFSKGLFTSRFSNPYNGISTAVEIFNQRKSNQITAADSASRIDALKAYDARSDLDKYVSRNKVQQQYQLNLSGGTHNLQYYLSGGYDNNLDQVVTDRYRRYTFNSNTTFSIWKDRLSLSADVGFVSSTDQNNPNTFNPNSPYDRMVDEAGNSLAVVLGSAGFRQSYADTVGRGKLLDWHYRPKDELVPNSQVLLQQSRIKTGINFKASNDLNLTVNYQLLNEDSNRETNNNMDSYYTRDMINKFSAISNDNVTRVIPSGDILNAYSVTLRSQTFRSQLNYRKVIANDHEVNAIAGYEGSDLRTATNNQTYYGYDPETMTHANATIDPTRNYKLYYSTGTAKINTTAALSGKININQSYYTNISYAYLGRYILSASARRDESNLFGVKTNQKGVPLWSAGLAWNIHRESFYHWDLLSSLKLRATYGYNGNVDKSVSAYTTARSLGILNYFSNVYAQIQNPPNPSLRWERVKTWNIGLDFSFKNNRVNGSLDVYQKNAVDLIGNNPIAFQSGIAQFKGNGANLQTQGLDLVLNSRNLDGKLKWNTSLLFNYNLDKVTDYKISQSSNLNIISGNFNNPLVGYPYYAIFSFPSAGLDNTGSPQGYLNGEISKDYAKIRSTLDQTQLQYHGSASPKYFGSLINTFHYHDFELSLNITYKFDYYFRRLSVFSGSNYGSGVMQYKMSDYEKRWQQPGDELNTKIPALVYPSNLARDSFFQNSSDLVERGDHIRLQDVRLSYNLSRITATGFRLIQKASLFLYARNLGILWRENKLKIDPDYGSSIPPQPFSGSFGINLTL